jgi:vancomycin resistance protein YoaR
MTVFVTLVVVPTIAIVLLAAIWAVDAGAHDGQVMRNTSVGAVGVGGLSGSDARTEIEALANQIESADVVIELPWGTEAVSNAELGVKIDVDATIDQVLDAGRDGRMLDRPVDWLGSLLSHREVEPVVDVDPQRAAATLAALEGDHRIEPVEPNFSGDEHGFELIAGSKGVALNVDDAVADLLQQARTATVAPSLLVHQRDVLPQIPDESVTQLMETAEQQSDDELTITIAGTTAQVPARLFRGAYRLAIDDDEASLAVDHDEVSGGLAFLFSLSELGQTSTPATFAVDEAGAVQVDPGTPGTACCTPESGQRVADALLTETDQVAVDLREIPDPHDEVWASELGIGAMVSEFTTRHAAGQSRVTNIQRMADIVRGTVIEPGELFSLNEAVGKRTREKGFVGGGVIYNGEFTNDIGGGVSQFATTLFNAAWFGGLDFEEYQAHTIYISRYPYGREATVSWPAPDLKIRNTTPHGILIWPSYDSGSITVRLYSTPFVSVEQTGQYTSRGSSWCSVTTERTRTYADGQSAVDNTTASYRSC